MQLVSIKMSWNVSECYPSKCVQKYTYHRLLVYNPKDYYYPFKVESFKLPSSCDCVAGAFHYDKEGYHKKHDIYGHPEYSKVRNLL